MAAERQGAAWWSPPNIAVEQTAGSHSLARGYSLQRSASFPGESYIGVFFHL